MGNLFWVSKLPVLMLLGCSAIGGGWLALTSVTWLGVWVGLELNLLSFLPLMVLVEGSGPEGGLKYFLTQACASLVLLCSIMFGGQAGVVLSVLALIMKAGGAPLHFWFPMVVESLSWGTLFMLMTVQKLIPLALLSYLYSPALFTLFWASVFGCAVVGALGGINETHSRKLLSFSSINHLGWMLMAMVSGGLGWVTYFTLYFGVLLSVIGVLSVGGIFHLGQSKGLGWDLGVSLLSLGGLPPLLGFVPKWLVIQSAVGSYAILVLIASSVVTLFYYIRLFSGSAGGLQKGWATWLALVLNGGGSGAVAVVWAISPLR
uniref:NADH-ubiquinone oxidoreductase chain 2 n=1 Tax=Eurydice pulchra TaxID=155694 RepID=E3SX83_EURPU|nr:NADH dehydrogenase subunit 2 [Eurydice pulchra]